ncbi:MAG TPA: helix-turn-helix domain-containing protein, partial [Solirubrobacteraceae bacterium]|nr:helix-turn-helix domain-containing protein [Solirubrobacteraceae bacterium]
MTLVDAGTTVAPGPAVALLDVEPEIAAGVPEEELALLRRHTTLPGLLLAAEPWSPPAASALGADPFALLVVEGLVTRSVALSDRASTQLHGPGDLVTPWHDTDGLVPAVVEWRVNLPTHVAVLDERVLLAARRWPSVFRLVFDRLACQAARHAVHTAIGQLPRVDTRIMAILWHLAERFGRVTPDGVVVPLRLTHEALGHLIGSQRPTVTLALRQLTEAGALHRTPEGAWVLRNGTQVDLAPTADAALPTPAVLPTPAPGEHEPRYHRD